LSYGRNEAPNLTE